MFTRKAFLVLAWEYTQRVKSKGFLFSLVFMPAVIVIFTLVPTYFASEQSTSLLTIAVADRTGIVVQALKDKLARNPGDQPINLLEIKPDEWDGAEEEGRSLVRTGVVQGFLALDNEILKTYRIRYFFKGVEDRSSLTRLERALQEVVLEQRLKKMNLDAYRIRELTHEIGLDLVEVDALGGNSVQRYIAGMIFVMMLFFAIFNSGGGFMRGLLEEKNSKIIEVLVTSVSPRELMSGKLLGLGLIGLTQLSLWSLVGALFGGSLVEYFVSPAMLGFLVVYFVLGYLLFASFFSVFGAVFSSEQDIQHLQGIISIVGVLPIAFAILVLKDPGSLLVNILSYVPFLTPTLMTLRLAVSHPPWYHLVGTIASLCVFLIFAMRFSGRIFEIALLMTGKRTTVPELWKWYRTST